MNPIVPAIIPVSREDLKDKLLQLQGIADHVQIDVVDGIAATPAAWPFSAHDGAAAVADALSFMGTLHVEADFMVEDAQAAIRPWVDAGANRIVLHSERVHALPKLLSDIHTRYGHDVSFTPGILSIGLAIHAATDISLLEPFLGKVDYVQFMGIANIGKQGEPFDQRVIPKIRTFKKKYPQMPLQVDGGVSRTTAPALLALGVDRLVVGSALWDAPDLAVAYRELEALTTRYGTYA